MTSKKKLQPYIVICPRCLGYLDKVGSNGERELYVCKKCTTKVNSPAIKDSKLKEVKNNGNT
jgi:tRNA(Ile2) C34 agmatinyltransferase TiaS